MTLDLNTSLEKLYEQACKEDGAKFEFYLKGISFHFGLVSALMGATVAGAIKAAPGYTYLLLLAGPVMTAIAAQLGIRSMDRLYLTWLEQIAVRAKLEQMLGLTRPTDAVVDGYWSGEPIIGARNLQDRKSYSSSEAFVKERMQKGYHLWTRHLFVWSTYIAGVMFMVLVFAAWKLWPA